MTFFPSHHSRRARCKISIHADYIISPYLFPFQVDHCMEAHRRKVRRAQRHKSKRHGGSNSSSSSSSNSEKDDEQEDEDELNVLGTRAFSRLPGAWWSLGRNSSSTSSDLLANAPLSPKVHFFFLFFATRIFSFSQ